MYMYSRNDSFGGTWKGLEVGEGREQAGLLNIRTGFGSREADDRVLINAWSVRLMLIMLTKQGCQEPEPGLERPQSNR